MKHILFILLITATLFSCKVQQVYAQELIAVEEHINYLNNETEIQDNTYFKDVNNLFDEFIGVWIGSYNDKNFTFIISETTEQSSIRPLSFDKLMINYKVTDISGVTLIDTTNLPITNLLVMQGTYFIENGESYQLSYYGEEFECGDFGKIFITVINNNVNPSELNVYFSQGHDINDPNECTNDVTIPFPRDVNFTLIKQ
ncbi:DUF6705 family protein [Winogradskyella thalassocola]|uniref:DUF6705 domain-containing protein n=1 Tax=Winogradskyella thalassocola TaxID=262004 RepID=A0A1G7XX96_9FLAO|nr:DUF6705 family protein [Winogradskyella thalassocola]SDG88804.1 hypothetical protein SAMN04489796_101858 [Winogradskyella thalassocola]